VNRLLCALSVLFALSASAQQVRYRTADTIYLDAGAAAGIAVGDRYEVVRNGAVIATIEVIFVAERSASAKLVNETSAIVAGDRVRRPGGTERINPPGDDRRAEARRSTETAVTSERRAFALSGTASFDAETDRSLGRLNLRARNIADLPLHARIRTRLSSADNGNRVYEASLAYETERFGVRAGRIGNSPYVGYGYLDGALARVTLLDNLEVGAFGGVQPDLRDLGFDAEATKYGAFVRYFGDTADVTVAAATVEDNPFVAVDGRLLLSENVSVFAHGRAGDEAFDTMIGILMRNVSLTYDRVDPGPDDDLRTTDQVINDFLRQGVRATYRNSYVHVGAGVRTAGSDDDANTFSATAGVSHPNLLGLSMGISATGFSSDLSDGLFAQARVGRRFGPGHSLELSGGALIVDEAAIDKLSTTAYVRGAVWIELPYDLFARGEAEFASGRSASAGNRFSLGAGYRF
jgi:hypothetical protein